MYACVMHYATTVVYATLLFKRFHNTNTHARPCALEYMRISVGPSGAAAITCLELFFRLTVPRSVGYFIHNYRTFDSLLR